MTLIFSTQTHTQVTGKYAHIIIEGSDILFGSGLGTDERRRLQLNGQLGVYGE